MAIFLLVVLFVGPGLIVNGVWKEHWGRARPFEVQNFGGERLYSSHATRPRVRNQLLFCERPRSHGFLLAQFGLGVKAPLLAFGGIGIRFVCGAWPHLAGQPFLSDIVFSFWTVYFSACVIATCFGLRFQKKEAL